MRIAANALGLSSDRNGYMVCCDGMHRLKVASLQ